MYDAARIADFKAGLRGQIMYETTKLEQTTASVSQIARFLRKYWSAFQERRERARVRAILYGMQDRELKDLGFARSEIELTLTLEEWEAVKRQVIRRAHAERVKVRREFLALCGSWWQSPKQRVQLLPR